MKRYFSLVIVLFCFCPVCCLAQAVDSLRKDTVSVSENSLLQTDTVRVDSLINRELQPAQEKFKPNPKKAILYSVFCPGLGQIYNRKYWKLPLVYGGFIGCTYAITWNSTQYNGYRRAYLDFISGDYENRTSWNDYTYGTYLSTNIKDWTADMKSSFSTSLKSAKDYYRRYRDMSIFITVGFYGLCILDAYVDAQLFDFDISPDLSMHVAPTLFDHTSGSTRSIGMQLSFAF